MFVKTIRIRNYRCLRSVDVHLNRSVTVVIGANDCGKSTLLEAVHIVLTGGLYGTPFSQQLHPLLFNAEESREFCEAYSRGERPNPPEIIIEAVLHSDNDDETKALARLEGGNNLSRANNQSGVRLRVYPDPELIGDLRAYLNEAAETRTLKSIPTEFYTHSWQGFNFQSVHPRWVPRSRFIDAGSVRSADAPAKYMTDLLRGNVHDADWARVSLAYRGLNERFGENAHVKSMNDQLGQLQNISDRALGVSLDSTASGAWENVVGAVLGNIPLGMVGRGEQASVHLRLAMERASTADVVLIEEPENHQSHTSLVELLDHIRVKADESSKQLIVTTHSSFVLNKMGVGEALLFRGERSLSLSALEAPTQEFFRKLPSSTTLRLILAQRAVLVEGPSDDLLVRWWFKRQFGCDPMGRGVDVLPVGLTFRRYAEIADPLGIRVAVVTDNDGDPEAARARCALDQASETVRPFVSDNVLLRTLEDHIVALNSVDVLNRLFGTDLRTSEDLCEWMKKRKTDWALKWFDDDEAALTLPAYIESALHWVLQ